VTGAEPTAASNPADPRSADAPDITGIVVPVPEAQAYALHPHITLLAPFRRGADLVDPGLHAELRGYFATVAPFDFKLVEVRSFPDAHVYLAPEPDERFREMTIALNSRYPDCPPYGGMFRDIIPHLTIDATTHPNPLPIDAYASVAELVHSHRGAWDVITRFALAG
jgi:2'-5' RNA ligase superfamily